MSVFALSAMVVCLSMAAAPAGAIPLTLTISDNNSSATIEPEADAGMYDWNVEGRDHLEQQWFWFRVGDTAEQNISSLPLTKHGTLDTNFDDLDDTCFLRYETADFKIELTLLISGGTPGSGLSDIAESIKIVSLTDQPLDFHFFQYCDLNLMGTVEDDFVEITNGNSATQADGGSVVSETVETPTASHHEVGIGSATWDSLNDDQPTTLSDADGPLGPGDLTWSFEWDFTLAPGGAYLISKDKHVTPEPAALSLLVVGGFGMIIRRRKNKA